MNKSTLIAEGKKYFLGRGVNQDYPQAFCYFSESIGRDQEKNSEAFQLRGRTLMAMGKFKEALYDLTIALQTEDPVLYESFIKGQPTNSKTTTTQ